ncbi:MAG TPA: exosortase-dependent surface protein XDP2 [Elainellaceae cyanobacterium]
MKVKTIAACAGLIASGCVTLVSAPAQAFSFTTQFTGHDPKGDIILDSVTLGDGSIINNFALVSRAAIISNDLWTEGNTGAASADKGDRVTGGLKQERVDNAGAVTALNTLNLNSIIDTEDQGNFVIDVFFDQLVDNVFVWERGMNSKLDIQALDSEGNLVGGLLQLGSSSTWSYAGYSIDTMEISGAQKVSSIGIGLSDFGVTSFISGLRVTSDSSYNGPDWKIVGSAAETADVPEPATLAGLGLIASALVLSRRRLLHA